MTRLPSVKTLESVLRVDRTVAKKVRLALEGPGALPVDHDKYRQHYNPPSKLDRMLDAVNLLVEGFGIEPIRQAGGDCGGYWGDIVALYVNTGDTYSGTVLFDVDRDTFYATDYGTWVETAERTHRYEFV